MMYKIEVNAREHDMEQQMHTIKPFGLRMPDDVKEWLTVRAKRSKRSMNSELLVLLEEAKQADETKEAA